MPTLNQIPGDRDGVRPLQRRVSSQTAGPDKGSAFLGVATQPEIPPHSGACNIEKSRGGIYA